MEPQIAEPKMFKLEESGSLITDPNLLKKKSVLKNIHETAEA